MWLLKRRACQIMDWVPWPERCVQIRQESKHVVVHHRGLTSDHKTTSRPPEQDHPRQSQQFPILKMDVPRIRLQEHMLWRGVPENHTESHKSRKNFDGPRIPLVEGECSTTNTRLNGQHGDQAAPLLGVSVYGPSFLWREHVHRSVWGVKSKGKGTPRTNGGGSRPDGDSGWQFRLKSIKDTWVVRPSADHTGPWRTREGGSRSYRYPIYIQIHP